MLNRQSRRTAQELEDTTEHDHEADFSAFIGADYEPGAEDTMLEYDFEELIVQSDGLFAFPDLDWDSDFSMLAEHFGVSKMPEYPEVDPELWLSISCGGEQILAVPYFSVNEQSSIKQCQIMVEENYFDTAQMQETFDLLLESAQTQLGQPVEDSLEDGSENMYFWRWQSQLEDFHTAAQCESPRCARRTPCPARLCGTFDPIRGGLTPPRAPPL